MKSLLISLTFLAFLSISEINAQVDRVTFTNSVWRPDKPIDHNKSYSYSTYSKESKGRGIPDSCGYEHITLTLVSKPKFDDIKFTKNGTVLKCIGSKNAIDSSWKGYITDSGAYVWMKYGSWSIGKSINGYECFGCNSSDTLVSLFPIDSLPFFTMRYSNIYFKFNSSKSRKTELKPNRGPIVYEITLEVLYQKESDYYKKEGWKKDMR